MGYEGKQPIAQFKLNYSLHQKENLFDPLLPEQNRMFVFSKWNYEQTCNLIKNSEIQLCC